MNASVYRKTRLEIREIHQGPNSFGVRANFREFESLVNGQAPRVPDLELHESLFTEEEMRQVHAVLEMLEKKLETVYAEWEAHPDRNKELIEQAVLAQKQLASLEPAIQRARVDLEKAVAASKSVDEQTVSKRLELVQLESELAVKRQAREVP